MGLSEIKIINQTTQYSTYEDGQQVCHAIQTELNKGHNIALSFENITGVPSSFINGLLDDVLHQIGKDGVKQRIVITQSTRSINEMLKRKMALS